MFDWDEDNIDHIARHGISPEEVEEALTDPHRIPAPIYRVEGERRAFLGMNFQDRLLVVVFTHRAGLLRPVMARDADLRERRRYIRRGK